MELLNNLKTNEKLVLLSILIIPFMKGLFFKEEIIPAFIFYTILFLIFIINSNTLMFDCRILILFILQIVFGISSAVFGINKEEAIYGIFTLLLPVIIYFLILNIIKDYYSFIYKTLLILFFSGSVISIINYLMELKFNSTESLIRFTWVIPYANTLAVYLFASSIAGLYLVGKKNFEIKRKVLIILGICLNISGLVFTYSRTMLVLAVVFYVVFTSLQKSKKIILDFIVIITLSGLCSVFYSLYKWKSFLVIFILCTLVAYLYESNCDKISLKLKNFYTFLTRNKKTLLILIPIIIFVIFFGILVLKSTDIYNRLQTISAGDQTLMERVSYYRDSIAIIKDFPLFGLGAGGWASIMYKYQTAVYFPTYVHSSIIQTALNYGLIGLMLFLMQIMIFIIYFISALRNKLNFKYRNEIISLFIINFSILVHSIIDIDFEFQIISILFWVNIALLSLLSGKKLVRIDFGNIKKIIISSVLIIICVISISIFTSNTFYIKGNKSYESQNFSLAINSYDKSIKFNPFSSGSYFKKGNALWEIYLESSDNKILEESKKNINIAKKYNRYNPEYLNKEAFILYMTQNYEECVKKYEELIILQPLELANYEAYSNSLLKKAEQEIKLGMEDQKKNDFNKIIKIESQLRGLKDKLSPFAFKLKHKPELTLSPELSYNVCEVYYYLQDFDKARYYAKIALKDDSYIQKISELENKFEKHK